MKNNITGNIVDIINKKIFPGVVTINNGIIESITQSHSNVKQFILPGFIDAHIHIESSLLIPSEFARLAVTHGTVATVSDPHEIGNVLGLEGIKYMLENSQQVPFHFYFGVPSCVPATLFETAGAEISAKEVEWLFKEYNLKYLSEMMNFPGVLSNDPEVLKKIQIAKKLGKPIDGHAPGLRGNELEKYVEAGIFTDHECTTLEEALEKIQYGMQILIREGSAAKNFAALHPLIKQYPERVMFCSDDKHPHELKVGHINLLVKRALKLGYDLMDVLRAASLNPVLYYQLETGLLRENDSADFIVVDNLQDFNLLQTYIKGKLVAEGQRSHLARIPSNIINHFNCSLKKPQDFEIQANSKQIHVINAIDDQLVTEDIVRKPKVMEGKIVSDPMQDILKLCVVNRYHDAPPAIGFVHNFGLKKGAIASCIAHDSHNIIAVGCTDEDICRAVNLVIKNKGGLSLIYQNIEKELALPIAGIMSHEDAHRVAEKYAEIEETSKMLGSKLKDPFMTLAFMALLVIPQLKLSDQGLFDGTQFKFTSLFVRDK